MAEQKRYYNSILSIGSFMLCILFALTSMLNSNNSSLFAFNSGMFFIYAVLHLSFPAVVSYKRMLIIRQPSLLSIFTKKNKVYWDDVVKLQRVRGWLGDSVSLSLKDGSTLTIAGTGMFPKRFEGLYKELRSNCASATS